MPESISVAGLSDTLNQVPWLSTPLYGNSIADYLFVILSVLVVFALTRGITLILEKHAKRLTGRTENKIDDQIVELVYRSITFICVLTVLYFGIVSLNLPPIVDDWSAKILFILFTIKVARELDRLSAFFIHSYLEPLARKQRGVTKTFLGPLSRVAKFIIWILAILLVVGNLGYNISSLLAGLGVGGLAFALAAQETLSNAFGSISVLSDQPFKIGDWVQINDVEGEVVQVGLRSTRIRTIDEKMVAIPNKITSSAVIQNYSKRKEFNVNFKIGVSYDTSMKQIESLKKKITQILNKEPDVNHEHFRVNVTDFGAFAIELTIFYYVTDVSSYARSISIRERVNLKIKEAIETAKITIPYPTQSLRITHADAKMSSTRGKKTHR